MKKALLIPFLICIFNIVSNAQVKILSIQEEKPGLFFLRYDSSALQRWQSKSLIVEFKNFVVLLEMPVVYSNSNITDHVAEGEIIYNSIASKFKNKPLKYIVSSHWHPHSISSIEPFISKGVKIITTAENLKILQPMIDSSVYVKYGSNIITLKTDSMVIQDKKNHIVLYKINKSEYSYLPTTDFIFSYLPKYQVLQTSCMYQRFRKAKIGEKEMISGRTENLNQFVKKMQIPVKKFTCTDVFFDESDGFISKDTLDALMLDGRGMLEVESELKKIELKQLIQKNDSLIQAFQTGNIPTSIINKLIYSYLETKNYEMAVAWGKLLVFLRPNISNYWDTLGEVYCLMGNLKQAETIEKMCKTLDPNYSGGIKEWSKNKTK
jgi:hypothetical protein